MRRQNQSDQPLGDHPDVVACAEAFADCVARNDLSGAVRCIHRGEVVVSLIAMARRVAT